VSASLYLSRARLRHDAPLSALRDVLSGLDATRAAAAHRLIWLLFSDDPDRERDFLWREAEPGVFYLLSERLPAPHELFHLDDARPFAPALAPGDRLHFVLRANATVARKREGAGMGVRGKRSDIVMDAIHALPTSERAGPRQQALPAVATRWLAAQGEKHGFEIAGRPAAEAWEISEDDEGRSEALDVMGYRVLRIGRPRPLEPLELGVLDLEGTLIVQDAPRFLAALAHGFGRGKAFGCGLILIRRAR
jgi:CRISPR system Cascade subunit CasE